MSCSQWWFHPTVSLNPSISCSTVVMSKRYTFKTNWSSLYTTVYRQHLQAWIMTGWREKTCSGLLHIKLVTVKLRNSNACGTSLSVTSFCRVGYSGVVLGDRELLVTELQLFSHTTFAHTTTSQKQTFPPLFMVSWPASRKFAHTYRWVPSSRTLRAYGVSQTALILNISMIIQHFSSLPQETSHFHPTFFFFLHSPLVFFLILYVQLGLVYVASRSG